MSQSGLWLTEGSKRKLQNANVFDNINQCTELHIGVFRWVNFSNCSLLNKSIEVKQLCFGVCVYVYDSSKQPSTKKQVSHRQNMVFLKVLNGCNFIKHGLEDNSDEH